MSDETEQEVAEEQIDTPVERATLDQLSEERMEAELDALRTRRMRALKEYQTILALKEAVLIAKYRKQADQHSRMFEKELATADRAIEKLEVRALKMISLKRQIEGALQDDQGDE